MGFTNLLKFPSMRWKGAPNCSYLCFFKSKAEHTSSLFLQLPFHTVWMLKKKIIPLFVKEKLCHSITNIFSQFLIFAWICGIFPSLKFFYLYEASFSFTPSMLTGFLNCSFPDKALQNLQIIQCEQNRRQMHSLPGSRAQDGEPDLQ